MTPRILNTYIMARNENIKTEYKNMLTHAYLVAGWTRVKRMPRIASVLKEQPKEMTAEQMLMQVKRLNRLHKGEVA